MKKLTIEQKAKRYDEAIKIAKSKIKNDKDHVLYEEDIIEIFHELKKKTDEEMIQKLIAVCHLYYGEGEDAERDACLKWLEKQKIKPYSGTSFVYNNHTWGMCARDGGVDILCDSKLIKHIEYPQGKTILENLSEQKQEWSKEDENECNHILKLLNLLAEEQETKGYNNLIICVNWLKSIKDRIQSKQSNKPQGEIALEAIEEEKVDNANKIEPKFNVGDWITDGNITIQIEAIKNNCYLYCGDCYLYSFKYTDKVYHLWTINDAKDGDVLVHSSFMFDDFIFIYNNTSILQAYCYYSNERNRFIIEDRGHYCPWNMQEVKPATKEQRDLLFQKIKEAGYEWDVKKKQLKNIITKNNNYEGN